ncbi:MAG: hypothetical protein LBU24_04460 [Methanocalculaceae archaeon]|jgi:D-3-phosphoglycerate dehydrogenase|nr:hypothetical protein [Methanocalculaceae archaeon]
MKISLIEPIGVSEQVISELAADLINAGHSLSYYNTKTADPKELAERSWDADIVIIANTPYPAEVIRQAEHLKMISVAFTGIDHIGADACRERGIAVYNAANYSNKAVAELVIGMTISLLRRLPVVDAAARNSDTEERSPDEQPASLALAALVL